MKSFDIIIIGGGAAGFFSAINVMEKNPNLKVAILERGKECLTKVKISGGGRCNVTHACFVPNDLVKFYPRGEKELKGPFYQFCSGDTIDWFEKHGVPLKIEEDGRMFPQSNSSQSIIDCFIGLTKKFNISIFTSQSVQELSPKGEAWKLETQNQTYFANKIIVATGSNPKMWELFQKLGHTIIAPVPSLFTFNIKDKELQNLMGISHEVSIKIKDTKLQSEGNLLITHWGVSGPAVLRLSAWGARILADKKYNFTVQINWLKEYSVQEVLEELNIFKTSNSKKTVLSAKPFSFTKRLWEYLINKASIFSGKKWADCTKNEINKLAEVLTQSSYQVNGKSTFKEEFVTAGGIELKEVDFKTMQSKISPNVYFAGEVLNIDAITGGFNFQNAWTSAFIVANSISNV